MERSLSPVRPEEFARLMGACEPGPHGWRARTMLWLAYGFALSACQVTALQFTDLGPTGLRLPHGVLALAAPARDVVGRVFEAARESNAQARVIPMTPRGARVAFDRIAGDRPVTWRGLRRGALRRVYIDQGHDAAARLAHCVGLSLWHELAALPVTGGIPLGAGALPRMETSHAELASTAAR